MSSRPSKLRIRDGLLSGSWLTAIDAAMAPAMAEPLHPDELPPSAVWLAQAYDPPSDMVRFVATSEQVYRDMSFLDDRLFQQWRDVRTMPWPMVQQAMLAKASRPAGWIFHTGHVGSTLIARMLGELDHVLSVREPRILRDLASLVPAQRNAMAPTVRTLFARTFRDDQSAIIKATSFVSEIAPMLVAEGGRAVFLAASPQAYIETILAGENSRKELHSLRQSRASRLAARVQGIVMPAPNDAHLAAIAWACEATSLEAAAEQMAGGNILWMNFDKYLADPEEQLFTCAAHLAIAASRAQAATIARGPLMARYSKDLSYEYSPQLRRDLLSQAARQHGREIDAAIALLYGLANHSPLLGRALRRFSRKD